MDLKIVRFTFLLFLLQVIKSEEDESDINEKVSDIVKKVLEEYNIKNNPSEYENSTISLLGPLQELKLQNEKTSLKIEKLKVSTDLMKELVEIGGCRMNISRHYTKMLARLEEFQYGLVSLIQENQKLDLDSVQDSGVNVLLDFEASEQLSDEYLKVLSEVKTLKYKIHSWKANIFDKKNDEVFSMIGKFSHDEGFPDMVWNGADKNSSSEIDPDEEDYTVEKLQRLSLLISDKLDEMPKEKRNEDFAPQRHLELLTVSDLPGGDNLPRWLLTKADLDEIHTKYLKWMMILDENSEHAKPRAMRADLIANGKSIELFCKNLSEYYNLTTILLQCVANDDTKCEEMVLEIMKQPHYKEVVEFFAKWGLQS